MTQRLFTLIMSQATGFLAGVAIGYFVNSTIYFPFIVLTLHSAISILTAYFLKCTRPWIILNGIIPIGIFLSTTLPLSYTALLLITLFVILLYIPTLYSGVPFYPTSNDAYGEILKLIPNDKELTFIDLGSGFGSLLKYLSSHRPQAKFIGVEISPMAWAISKIRFYRNKNISIFLKDMWDLDLEKYDFVYAFLAPGPMPRLWQKVKKEMRPKTVFITNTFDVGIVPTHRIKLQDTKQSELLVFDIT